ncbi:MAG: stage II sporulation protein M [Lacrimispora sp.]|uniref:stage II sporulation protein M n=1 Tax=Lacrimispora sp. TaxID=2719234 RepID=UPI0039E4AE18
MAEVLDQLKFQPEGSLRPLENRAWDRYILCFLAGLVAGTAAANFWYPAFMEEAGYYLALLEGQVNLNQAERLGLFGQVFRQRAAEVWIAWLMGLTVYGAFLFCLLTAGMGFSMGFILSVITIQKGLMGLPVFLMSMMPQGLLYIPLWGILLFWGMQKERRFRIPAFLLLLALAALGSACEAWLNPVFLKFVL